jgi:hypothetical protein
LNNVTAYIFKDMGIVIVKNNAAQERRWNADHREALRPRPRAFLTEDPDHCMQRNILAGKLG